MTKDTAEGMTIAKIFEGCRHPVLIDEYIKGVEESAVESKLQALRDRVKFLHTRLEKGKSTGINKPIDVTRYVIEIIDNIE